MLTIDTNEHIIDYNIAVEVLLGANVGWRYQPAGLLLKRIEQYVEGDLLPPLCKDVKEYTMRIPFPRKMCLFHSIEFGKINLCRSAINHLNPENGEYQGMTVFWELLWLEREQLFREVLHREHQRRLLWETYAISYDRVLPRLPFYRDVVERHLATLSSPEVVDILDLGAGTGNVAVPLAQKGRRVSAVDTSRAMLARMRGKIPDAESDNLIILEQNAENLPQWMNESFDGINILLALFDMYDPLAALQEAIRVLRPGGLLVVTEPKRCFNLQSLLVFAETYLREKGVWESLSDDWARVTQVNKVLNPSTRSPLFAEDITERLKTAGFWDFVLEDSHLGNCCTITAKKPKADMSSKES